MESRLFDPASPPEFTTAEWYATRERAPHLEEPAHQPRLFAAAAMAERLWTRETIKTVVDLGAGDGGLLQLMVSRNRLATMWGYDLQPSNIMPAMYERGVSVQVRDVVNDDISWGHMAICTEMLEHLIDPHAFVRKIREHSEYLIASSPVNETAESHYAFHLWAWDADGYNALLDQGGFDVVERWEGAGFQVVLGHAR